MREQRGCICIDGKNWAVRWRETVRNETGAESRKLRFKVLGLVTAEHWRNKDRETGKLRIPKEIEREAKRVMSPVNVGNNPRWQDVLMTIGEFVESYYFPESFVHLKPSTQKGYRDMWRLHLRDKVAGKIMRDFERRDASDLWKEIRDRNPQMSRRTMSHIRFLLSGIFENALDRGWYSGGNPCNADLPKGLKHGGETGHYTIEEVARMLSLLANVQAQAVVALAFGSGLRKGEIAGLRWEDMEATESGAILHVRRSVWNGVVTTPKTESSRANVRIDAAFLEYVEAYRQFAGGLTEGFMFGYSADSPINLDSFSRWKIKPVLKRAGIEWKGWHGYRRGNATFLARHQGADVAALMLRHSSVSTTQDHYIKDTAQDRRRDAARRMDEAEGQRQAAAQVLGAGLKGARVQ